MKNIIKRKKRKTGQVMIEFTFCMIVIMVMIYSTIMIFRWTGLDLAERRIAHDTNLRAVGIDRDYSATTLGDGPLRQIDPYFYKPIKMNAIWDGF